MRKLIVFVVGTLTSMSVSAVVVWQIAQAKTIAMSAVQGATSAASRSEMADRSALAKAGVKAMESLASTGEPGNGLLAEIPGAVPVVSPVPDASSRSSNVQPAVIQKPNWRTIPGESRILATDVDASRSRSRAPFDAALDARPSHRLATSLQLASDYENVIRPDEDLLQGSGLAPLGTEAAVSGGSPENRPILRPSSPQALPSVGPLGERPGRLSGQDSVAPDVGQPPAHPWQGQTTAPDTPDLDPDSGQPAGAIPWSRHTRPFPDEDLLQGAIDELPPPTPGSSDGPLAPGSSLPRRLPPTPSGAQTPDRLPSISPGRSPGQTPAAAPGAQNSPFVLSQPTQPPPSIRTPPPTTGLAPHGSSPGDVTNRSAVKPGEDPHLAIYAKNCFPSAAECKACHEKIYEEWAGSSHAYAAISPMFQKFEQTIHGLSMGTISHFCMRCHAPVATSMAFPREGSIFDAIPVAREGVTCIACHRVNENYGKVNGERRIEMGDINQPMYGAGYGQKLAEMIKNKSAYKIKTSPDEKGPGQQIHTKVIHFEQISDSSFCVSCHQVAVAPGISLEVVWAQYRASPACREGITCQECHMGIEPGVAAGYATAPVAVVNGKEIDPGRKHSNHMFFGPGYSIAHPGLFPHEPKANQWTAQEWLQFDYRQGWGTEAFEEMVESGRVHARFPDAWDNVDDRADAREIVDKNLERLEAKRRMRHRLMENGSHLEGPIFAHRPAAGQMLRFHYDITNTNPGHNMPSGSLGAQPQVWLNVVLTGPRGQRLWESGYVDRNGDIADVHSLEVAAGRIPRDTQLFNLQTKFLITGVKGTDREHYVPINTDFDQLPFIRQSAFPVTVMNHPPFIRMEAHSIPPLGTFQAKYHVPARLMKQPGVYRLSVRMRSRAEPIYFMRFCRSTPEMERNMNYWMLDYHEDSFSFRVQ